MLDDGKASLMSVREVAAAADFRNAERQAGGLGQVEKPFRQNDQIRGVLYSDATDLRRPLSPPIPRRGLEHSR
jgi:hypothetical protein